MIPQSHPFIVNFFHYRDSLSGLGNSLRVVVENRNGDIFDRDYLEVVRQVNDKIYLRPGVDRAWMKSVWTPATRWTEITEEGYRGGPVMPFDYNGSPESVAQFRVNVQRAGLIGRLVGSDLQVEHDRGAAARAHSRDRRADRLRRAVALPGARDPQPGDRTVPDPHHRLRETRRRPHRRHPDGAGVLRDLRADRDDDHLRLYARCAQHAAAGWRRGARRGVAHGHAAGLRLRAEPLLGARAFPGVRDRHLARRPEDERHHAGRRARHPPLRGRALHLPPAVRGGAHGAAHQRVRLRGDAADRHTGHSRPGDHHEHRRR
jgi:hypothetical protein